MHLRAHMGSGAFRARISVWKMSLVEFKKMLHTRSAAEFELCW